MLLGPTRDPLKFVKECVDPPKDQFGRQTTIQRNFHQLKAEEFKLILQSIHTVFTQDFHKRPIWEKVEAIWLHMSLSLFMRHQIASLSDREAKLALLNNLDKEVVGIIGNTIAEINDRSTSYGFYKNRRRDFHQKMLHIHWNLPRYYQHLTLAKIMTPESLLGLPLGVTERKLRISQEESKSQRESEPQYKGEALTPESQVNAEILKHIHAGTQVATLKDPNQKKYIDEKTGLELDLPLSYRLSVETDGEKHVAHGIHTVIHTMKALAFRESGGQRIPLDVNQTIIDSQKHVKIAQSYGEILRNQAVLEYLNLTNQFDALRCQLRETLEDIQDKYAFPHDEEKRRMIREHFQEVLKVEALLRDFANRKNLEKFFLQVQNAWRGLQHGQDVTSYLTDVTKISQYEEQLTQLKTKLSLEKQNRPLIEEKMNVLLAELEQGRAHFSRSQLELEEQLQKRDKYQRKFDALSSGEKLKHTAEHLNFISNMDTHIAYIENKRAAHEQSLECLEAMLIREESAFAACLESETELCAKIETKENQIADLENQKQLILRSQLESEALKQLLATSSARLHMLKESLNASLRVLKEVSLQEQNILPQQPYVPGFAGSREKRAAEAKDRKEPKLGRTDNYDYARAVPVSMV